MRQSAFAVVLLVVGLGAGWFAGRQSNPSPTRPTRVRPSAERKVQPETRSAPRTADPAERGRSKPRSSSRPGSSHGIGLLEVDCTGIDGVDSVIVFGEGITPGGQMWNWAPEEDDAVWRQRLWTGSYQLAIRLLSERSPRLREIHIRHGETTRIVPERSPPADRFRVQEGFGRLIATVRDVQGKPIVGHWVSVVAKIEEGDDLETETSDATNDAGVMSLDLRPGAYDVTVGSIRKSVLVPDGAEVAIHFDHRAHGEVRIDTGEVRAPILRLYSLKSGREVGNPRRGRVVFVPPGPYDLSLYSRYRAGPIRVIPVEVTAGGLEQVTVALPTGAVDINWKSEGKVLPAIPFPVMLEPLSGGEPIRLSSTKPAFIPHQNMEDGVAWFPGHAYANYLEPGGYRVRIRAEGWRDATAEFTVGTKTAEVELVVRRDATATR